LFTLKYYFVLSFTIFVFSHLRQVSYRQAEQFIIVSYRLRGFDHSHILGMYVYFQNKTWSLIIWTMIFVISLPAAQTWLNGNIAQGINMHQSCALRHTR